jgi:hypothetical protein
VQIRRQLPWGQQLRVVEVGGGAVGVARVCEISGGVWVEEEGEEGEE